MVDVAVAEHRGDLADAMLAAPEQSFCALDAQVFAVLHYRDAKLLAEAVAQIGLAHVAECSNLGKTEASVVVAMDVRERGVEGRRAALRDGTYAAREPEK